MKISVIILDFLKAELVLKNVEWILKQKWNFNIEIIIVDNSCNKNNEKILKTLEKNTNIKLLIQKNNIWYSKWNNLWVKNSNWDFIFIINPDILIKNENIFQKMINFMEKNKDIWIIWPKQENLNWSYPLIIRKFPNIFTQILRRTFLWKLPVLKYFIFEDEKRYDDLTLIRETDWLQSSFFMMKKIFWNEIWWFNEDYFIFMADSQLCFDSWKKWKKVIYYPKVKVFADWKRLSSWWVSDFFNEKILRYHFKDSLKYFIKNLFEWNPRKRYYLNKNDNLI